MVNLVMWQFFHLQICFVQVRSCQDCRTWEKTEVKELSNRISGEAWLSDDPHKVETSWEKGKKKKFYENQTSTVKL
jgi:hypothetical protein